MRKKLAVIGANAPLIPYYKQAKALGYYIVGIALAENAVCREYCDCFYPISFKDKNEVLRVCREERIDGITSFSLESALPTVVYVAQTMGLVSNTEECIRLTKTKFAQRKALELNGISVPKYFRVKNEADLASLDLCFPIIIKPVDSGGSQGVTKLNTFDGILKAYRDAIAHSPSKVAIIEEFVDGREFSVEYISCKGKHYFLQITDKVTSESPHFIEMQHHQPAAISDELASQIKCVVEKALTALKVENSPSHTEIKLNSKGELFIIEIGARMGGDFISSDLVRLSTGYDMVKGAIELATGHFTEPNFTAKNFSGIYFYSQLAPHIGKVIRNHEKYPEIVECAIQEEPLPEVHSNADRGGYLLYQSETRRLKISK